MLWQCDCIRSILGRQKDCICGANENSDKTPRETLHKTLNEKLEEHIPEIDVKL